MTDRPSPDPDAEWWTSTDVADYLGVQVKTVSAYRHRKQMPEPDRRIGRSWIWKPERIIEWHNEPGRRRKSREAGQDAAGGGESRPPA
ncbi:helix-turn-helix domain-containing protein [Pseudonocardia kongjuensis]